MKVVLIYAHPDPRSFNAAIAAVVREELEKIGAEIKFKDLYAMHWNPVLSAKDYAGYDNGTTAEDIKAEQTDISWADVIIMICPVWWNSVPAILKGYIDRVFSIGFAYEFTASGPRGMLNGKKALLITTSGVDKHAAEQSGMMELINKSLVDAVFGFSGFAGYQHKNFFAVPTVSDNERQEMLTELRQFIQNFI
ncbi:MAG: Glutathione-regulated potassium-efflux system ancillary protein KefF [Pelotomaculum sp. PtaB.Bin104]|nr:MAG: Glutathione-regulated potassium-efflux system ancillary protein KefF [Pelotomaculum sp. PtaB.Bin104]